MRRINRHSFIAVYDIYNVRTGRRTKLQPSEALVRQLGPPGRPGGGPGGPRAKREAEAEAQGGPQGQGRRGPPPQGPYSIALLRL